MTPSRIEKVWIWGIVASCAVATLNVGELHAQPRDYALQNHAWNGLSELREMAAELGLDLQSPAELELGQLRERDGLLLIYPTSPPAVRGLSAFMAAGGRVAIADDFGEGGDLLASLGVGREPPNAEARARNLRGNPNLLVVQPRRSHALTEGVRALVTNHPQMLRHTRLEPIFGESGRAALVLAGSVGAGRLVAIGDPSVLINNMLGFEGNRAFALALLRYLAPSGRLFIATATTALRGEYSAVRTPALADVRAAVQKLGQLQLPPAALQLTTLVIACLSLIVGATALPRRAAYLRAVTLPAPETYGGFAGRVRLFSRKRANLVLPALAYKQGLEQRLVQTLALAQRSSLGDVTAALQRAGLRPSEVARAKRLLVDLQAIAIAHEAGSPSAQLGRRKFHAMVSTGERILAALGEQNARASRA